MFPVLRGSSRSGASARSGFITTVNRPWEDLNKDYDVANIGCLESVPLVVVHVNYITIISPLPKAKLLKYI